ncbi:hypothetical protein CLU79DRAFT_775918 [Phycomyces nitens]|nr:hypothetical protein CLU79DRAFT_775918 [Phycomyces nitens]
MERTIDFAWLDNLPITANDPSPPPPPHSLDFDSKIVTQTALFSAEDTDLMSYLFPPNQVQPSTQEADQDFISLASNLCGTSDYPQPDIVFDIPIAPSYNAPQQEWINDTPKFVPEKSVSFADQKLFGAKKYKEPIFVTESPQNAYKKKKGSRKSKRSCDGSDMAEDSNRPDNDDDDDDDEAMDEDDIRARTKHLSPKERRQLRNKISARNFRVRRKEYIGELEEKISNQETAMRQLREENRRLTEANTELFQELQQWRQGVMSIPSLASPPSSLSSDSHNSPIQATNNMAGPTDILRLDFDSLYDFGPFDNLLSNSTYLSYTVIPDFDFFRNINEKNRLMPAQENDTELIRAYPLLAPALMSIVMHHTFTLNYAAYLADSFPYSLQDDNPFSPKATFCNGGQLNPEEWFGMMVNLQEDYKDSCGSDDETTCGEYEDNLKECPTNTTVLETKSYVLDKWHTHYVMWKVCGYSEEKIMEKFADCVEKCEEKQRKKKRAKEEKARRKATKAPLGIVTTARSVVAFCTIANTLLRNPNSAHQIGRIVDKNKYINSRSTPKGSIPGCNDKQRFSLAKSLRPLGMVSGQRQ